MRSSSLAPVVALALSSGLAACAPRVAHERPRTPSVVSMQTVGPRELCVTEGRVEDRGGNQMEVDSPAMRAVVAGSAPEVAELRFVYEGPTQETTRLADGEVRRQAGLKLRAADSCNVVYVIWRFEPEPRLVVSVKSNPGQHEHSECGDAGYRNVRAESSSPVTRPQPGEEHVMQAELSGQDLRVLVDGSLAWRGSLGKEGDDEATTGPVGIRTDNAKLAFELAAIPAESRSGRCVASAD